MDILKMRKEMHDEHQAWIDMFHTICEIFGITKEKLNENKYKIVFEMIER
jgi:hypothetical protein